MEERPKEKTPAKRHYELKSQQTIQTVQTLINQGIDKMSVIIRHSDRHYHRDPMMEPFMGLTEAGKTYAFDMGRAFPAISPVLHTSHFGRCIETAYLIDKGFALARQETLPHTRTQDMLTPFYIKDIERSLEMMVAQGNRAFIRSWFDHAIDEEIMENPESTTDKLIRFMTERLEEVSSGQIAVCVSHDWNIFPIREFKLGLPHESAGDVGYLDGVVFFKDQGKTFAVTHQTEPIEV